MPERCIEQKLRRRTSSAGGVCHKVDGANRRFAFGKQRPNLGSKTGHVHDRLGQEADAHSKLYQPHALLKVIGKTADLPAETVAFPETRVGYRFVTRNDKRVCNEVGGSDALLAKHRVIWAAIELLDLIYDRQIEIP